MQITAVTGWDLDDSPCGQPCDEGDVGKSTREPRDKIIQSTGSENHFGEWHLEIMVGDQNKETYMKKTINFSLCVRLCDQQYVHLRG